MPPTVVLPRPALRSALAYWLWSASFRTRLARAAAPRCRPARLCAIKSRDAASLQPDRQQAGALSAAGPAGDGVFGPVARPRQIPRPCRRPAAPILGLALLSIAVGLVPTRDFAAAARTGRRRDRARPARRRGSVAERVCALPAGTGARAGRHPTLRARQARARLSLPRSSARIAPFGNTGIAFLDRL